MTFGGDTGDTYYYCIIVLWQQTKWDKCQPWGIHHQQVVAPRVEGNKQEAQIDVTSTVSQAVTASTSVDWGQKPVTLRTTEQNVTLMPLPENAVRWQSRQQAVG